MKIEPAEFRRVLGHLATAITVVAARDTSTLRLSGLTANAVTAVSLDPPLVLACVDQNADTHDVLRAGGAFSVNVLHAAQEAVARHFARLDEPDKFEGVSFRIGRSGAPILTDHLAWIDCRLWAEYPGGDHTIYVGEVLDAGARDGEPLLYFRGAFGRYRP